VLRKVLFVVFQGTNLQSLIDNSRDASCPYRIVLVLSNKVGVKGLERAKRAGLPTTVRMALVVRQQLILMSLRSKDFLLVV